jgi:hypothetical protein
MSCHACNGTGFGPCQDHLEACGVCGGFGPSPPDPDDASTGTPFKDVPPGKVFRSTGGFIGMKRACGLCVSYADGGDAMLDPDAECFRIVIGGWAT